MITVTTDQQRKLVIAGMAGFLSPADVAAFAQDEQRAVRSMGLKSGEFDLLVIAAESFTQSQDVTVAFQALILHADYKARRIAVVRESSLTRMQTARILKIRDNAAVFGTRAEAEAWLCAEALPVGLAAVA